MHLDPYEAAWCMRYYLIFNPNAGRGRSRALLEEALAFFRQHDIDITVLTTERSKHATELVCQLPLDAVVLSLGGDGTLHEVVNGCVYTGRTVGILPAGSGDDFAFALGLERHDMRQALEVIKQGKVKTVDTAKVSAGQGNGETFINAFGVGFDADVAYGIYTAPKFLKERNAYFYSIFATLSRLENIPVAITIDGENVFDGPALLVSTQNGPRTGGSFLFAPEAKLDDGLLDIVIAGEFGRLGTLDILPKVLKGTHVRHPKVKILRGRNIRLEWQRPRPGHMEGELLKPATTFDIRIQAASLKVFAS
jgi:diacylglycerol kinase (ATP)